MTSQPSQSHSPIAVLLCNLGTPAAPTPQAVKHYLAEFLGDRRVVELPAWLWQPILHGIILQTRPRESARKYQSIWTEQGSPLLVNTVQQATLLRGWLGESGHRDIIVEPVMRYGEPNLIARIGKLHQQGIRRILIVPLYPQYSSTTTASLVDAVNHWSGRQRDIPEFRWINHYSNDLGYIQALERSVIAHWQRHGKPQKLVMSYHGIPARNVALGDPYQKQCLHTSRLLAERLGLTPEQYLVSFQSRFGRAKWLQPYTQPSLEQQARNGLEVVDVICPGFSSDCIETLEEINMEVRAAFLANGGKEFRYIPCLNGQHAWISALQQLVLRNLGGWLD